MPPSPPDNSTTPLPVVPPSPDRRSLLVLPEPVYGKSHLALARTAHKITSASSPGTPPDVALDARAPADEEPTDEPTWDVAERSYFTPYYVPTGAPADESPERRSFMLLPDSFDGKSQCSLTLKDVSSYEPLLLTIGIAVESADEQAAAAGLQEIDPFDPSHVIPRSPIE